MINHRNTNRTLAATLIGAFALSACAVFTPPPPFPTDPNAKNYYDAGERFLEAQRYELAAAEYEKSLYIESVAYISHSKLSVAYFGQQKFADAARQFEASYQLWGGPSSGPAWALLEAVSLQRAGDQDEAETLLRSWTGPGVVITAVGAYSAGQPLTGFNALLARYLQGTVDENIVLDQATSDDLPLAYLVIGISNAANSNTEDARKFLQLAADVNPNRSGWSHALARAEMWNLE